MILVEGLFLVAHRGVIRPRLGDHHHDCVRQGAAGQNEQLQAIVEHGGVAAVGIDDRQQLFQVLVLVEKREWTRARALSIAGFVRSGKN